MKQWLQWNNNQCSLCKDRSKPKTATHLLTCMALVQQAIWEEAVQLVQERADPLQDQKLAALSFMNQPFQVPTCLPGTPTIRQAIAVQQEIGMEWTLRGMVSLHWWLMVKQDLTIPRGIQNWSYFILKQFWKMAWQLWQARNDAIHNSSTTQTEYHLRGKVTREFKQGIYLLPRADQDWVQGMLPELLKWSHPYLQQWLQTIQAIHARERCRHGGQCPINLWRSSGDSWDCQLIHEGGRERKEGKKERGKKAKKEEQEKGGKTFALRYIEGMKQQHMAASMVTSVCIKLYGGYETKHGLY